MTDRPISNWHARPANACAEALGADAAHGLTPGEAARRLARDGDNVLPARGTRPLAALVAAQFRDVSAWLLIVAAAIAASLGETGDAAAIAAILVLNAAFGAAQHWRAERALAALRNLAPRRARVRRDDAWLEIDAAHLVVGDVVALEAGASVPADVRLIEAESLRIEEAALTGESVPVEKRADGTDAADAPRIDRGRMGWMGTQVVHGRGVGLVVATGTATALGDVAALMARTRRGASPLSRTMARFARRLALVALVAAGIAFATGLARDEPLVPVFLTAVSLAVAVVPEALPAVVTVALALGARRLARANALARRLDAIEGLGAVRVMCVDKTGTLTIGRMTLVHAWTADGTWHATDRAPLPAPLAHAVVLCADATRDDGTWRGDPTEVALVATAAAVVDVDGLRRAHPRLAELPFDTARRRMTTLHADGDGVRLVIKGAPEVVLPLCAAEATASDAQRAADAFASAGGRVLAVAERRLASLPADPASAERDLSLLGLVVLEDPPRPEARDAVQLCRDAGIRVVMLTGDHPATGRAIATAVGIGDAADAIVSGDAYAAMTSAERRESVRRCDVFARVTPEQKLALLDDLQADGTIVAMTGDGVNDAPALRRADVGVAMGRGGTDVAREAADLVLLDDRIGTLVSAVREGRRIHDNIRRFVRVILAGNLAEVLTVVGAPLLGWPVPLLPVQILWINLVTDGLPGLALAGEAAERDVMRRPPRAAGASLLGDGLGRHVAWAGTLLALSALAAARVVPTTDPARWRTMVFLVLSLGQVWHVLVSRRDTAPWWDGVTANRALLALVGGSALLQLSTPWLPPVARLLQLQPLAAHELGAAIAASLVLPVAVEIAKAARRDRSRRHGGRHVSSR